jgi:membrane fusion protein, multidrug efflux system
MMQRPSSAARLPAVHARVAAGMLWALLALLASGCKEGNGAAEKNAAGPPPAPVVVAQARRMSVPLNVIAVGNVEPIETVAVKSRIDGEVVAVHVRDGQDVRKGDLLFELDARLLLAQLRQLEAQEARDRALLSNAQSLEQRYADLRTKGFVSEEAYTQARYSREAAEATVGADRAAVESARVQLSYTRVLAPISGRVGRVMLPVGNTVKANDTSPLVVINQVAPIYVSFAVTERYLAQIRALSAQRALEVRATPQGSAEAASGKLTFIDNTVDAQTGTIRLRATFANQDRQLWPGQFVTAALTLLEQPDALVVPAQALQNGPKGQYVFVVTADQTAEVRSIVVERTEGGNAVVGKGLEAGETVITAGQLRVVPGGKVAPKAG